MTLAVLVLQRIYDGDWIDCADLCVRRIDEVSHRAPQRRCDCGAQELREQIEQVLAAEAERLAR